MTTLATLVVKVVGDVASYSAAIQQSQSMTDTFTSRAMTGLSSMGGAIVVGAMATGAAAVTGLGAAAWNAGEQIDEAMDIVQIGTGASGDALEGLRGTFEDVFSSTPTDANLAATAISELNTRLGLTGPMLGQNSTQLLNMSRLLGGDVQANAGLFARVVGDWNVPLEENSLLMDKIFTASQLTGVGVETLMGNVVQFGAPMRNMNFSLDEAISLFAKWEKEGVNAELVMGSLRIAAGQFARDNIPLRQGLDETFESIKNASDESEALSIAMGVFGARAAGDMSAAIREGRFDIDDMVAALGSAEGKIEDTAAATADWPEMWRTIGNTMTVQLAPMGDVLREIAGEAIGMFRAFVSTPEAQAFIVDLASNVRTFGGMALEWMPKVAQGFRDGFGWLEQNRGVVVAALAMIGAAVLAFGITTAIAAWTAMAPLLPVIAVLALVGAAAYLLYEAWTNNWGGIRENTATAVEFVKGVIDTGLAFILGIWDRHGAAILAVGGNTWQIIVNTIDGYLTFIKEIFAAFRAAFEGDWEGFGLHLGNAWKALWEMATANFRLFGENIKIIAGEWWRNLVDFFRGLDWPSIGKNILEGIKAGFSFGLDDLFGIIGDVVSGMQDAFQDPLEINSPSGWARREVGLPTGEGAMLGAVDGVERNKGRLGNALGNIAPGLSGGTARSGGGATVVVPIAIHSLIVDRNQIQDELAPYIINEIREYLNR